MIFDYCFDVKSSPPIFTKDQNTIEIQSISIVRLKRYINTILILSELCDNHDIFMNLEGNIFFYPHYS